MRTIIGRLAALAALLLLAGCARAPMETEADQAARSFFQALRTGDWAAVDAGLAPAQAATPDHRLRLSLARQAIPGGEIEQVKPVGWTRTEKAGRKRLTALHLYRYPGADLVVSTTLERSPPSNAYKVSALVLNRLAPGQVEANRFTLKGKGVRQFSFLASAALSPLVMLGVALMAAFTRGLSWKPLWVALCFVGIGAAYMNWTNGQGGFIWTQVALIGLGANRATDISPWIVHFAAPAGAILVLVRLLLRREPVPAKT
jgi:hypothetical protein